MFLWIEWKNRVFDSRLILLLVITPKFCQEEGVVIMVNCSSGRITYVKPVKTNIVTQKWGNILYNNKGGMMCQKTKK